MEKEARKMEGEYKRVEEREKQRRIRRVRSKSEVEIERIEKRSRRV